MPGFTVPRGYLRYKRKVRVRERLRDRLGLAIGKQLFFFHAREDKQNVAAVANEQPFALPWWKKKILLLHDEIYFKTDIWLYVGFLSIICY